MAVSGIAVPDPPLIVGDSVSIKVDVANRSTEIANSVTLALHVTHEASGTRQEAATASIASLAADFSAATTLQWDTAGHTPEQTTH